MKRILSGILAFAVALSTTGCVVTPADIKADGAAVSSALLAIAKLEAVADPTLAANLTTAANDLVDVTANWDTSSDVAKLNTVATIVEATLASIPPTAIIAPLIPIAVAALDILLANVGSSPALGVSAKIISPHPASIPHRLLRSPEGDFKAAWNGVIKIHPELKAAELK